MSNWCQVCGAEVYDDMPLCRGCGVLNANRGLTQAEWDEYFRDQRNDQPPPGDLPTEEEIRKMAQEHGLDNLPF